MNSNHSQIAPCIKNIQMQTQLYAQQLPMFGQIASFKKYFKLVKRNKLNWKIWMAFGDGPSTDKSCYKTVCKASTIPKHSISTSKPIITKEPM